MTRLRHAPVTLAALHTELLQADISLNDEIRTRLKAWANDSVRRLSFRLAIVVAFPIATPDGKTVDDLRAFISLDTAGQIGVKWGVLHNAKAAGVAVADDAFVRAVPEAAPSGDGEVASGGAATAAGALRPAVSRADAYRQLAQAAALLRQLEPHSPIPYLIQRAVELGSMPFPQLIRALIREQNVLTELNRELGIKEGGTPPSG